MRLEINLVSPEARMKRLEKIRNKREQSIFGAFFVVLGIILLAYGSIWWGLSSLKNSFTDQISVQSRDVKKIEDTIQGINKELSAIETRTSSYVLWTSRIHDVVFVIPAGIRITKLGLQEKPEALIVTGTALAGSDVVTYQAALEKLPWVDHVVAPLQNFARAPDAMVTFTIFRKKSP